MARLDVLSAWTFLTPVFGITLAAVVLGERPSSWAAAGLAAVLAAMGVVLRPGKRVQQRRAVETADLRAGTSKPAPRQGP